MGNSQKSLKATVLVIYKSLPLKKKKAQEFSFYSHLLVTSELNLRLDHTDYLINVYNIDFTVFYLAFALFSLF